MIDFLLLFFLVVCAIAAIQMKDLLSAIMILGAYSLIMAVVWTRLNAVDVAFTEASVGAGITTILLIAALSRTRRGEDDVRRLPIVRRRSAILRMLPVLVVIVTGAVLVYGTIDMPDFGDPDAPVNLHVAPRYIESSYKETGVVNFVTAVLASYRGYDTLGETTVIFTAGICVVLLLRRKRER
jgi:multicomponent Na+:H+ antiporter subunit B